MERHCSVTRIKPEKFEEYKRLHDEIWDEVVANAHRFGLRNYSIFTFGEYYISYFEYVGDDFERDMAEKAKLEVNRHWSAVCSECFEPCEAPTLMFHHDF